MSTAINTHDFEPTMLRYGGQPKRGFRIVCGNCGVDHKEPVNSAKGYRSKGDEHNLMRNAARKFVDAGWFIGKRQRDDRCARCKPSERPALRIVEQAINAPAPAAAKISNEGDTMVQHGNHNRTVDKTIYPVPLEEPRQMGRDDRRLVFEKINEVYDKDRYTGDWTDKKVAENLGCPRAWVATIRDEMFGPEGGNDVIFAEIEATRACLKDVKAVLDAAAEIKTQAQVALDRANAIARETAPLQERMTRLDLRLRDLEKMLR